MESRLQLRQSHSFPLSLSRLRFRTSSLSSLLTSTSRFAHFFFDNIICVCVCVCEITSTLARGVQLLVSLILRYTAIWRKEGLIVPSSFGFLLDQRSGRAIRRDLSRRLGHFNLIFCFSATGVKSSLIIYMEHYLYSGFYTNCTGVKQSLEYIKVVLV